MMKTTKERYEDLIRPLLDYDVDGELPINPDTLLRTNYLGEPEQWVESIYELDPDKVLAFIENEKMLAVLAYKSKKYFNP